MADATYEVNMSFELFRAIGDLYKRSENLINDSTLQFISFEIPCENRGKIRVKIRPVAQDDILKAAPEMQSKYPLLCHDESGRKRFTRELLTIFSRQWGETDAAEKLDIRKHEFDQYMNGVRSPRVSTLALWKVRLEDLPPNLKEDEEARLARIYPDIWKQIGEVR